MTLIRQRKLGDWDSVLEQIKKFGSSSWLCFDEGQLRMNSTSNELAPKLDDIGRWYWPDPDCECVRMMRRAGRFRVVLTTWLEEQIAALVDLPDEVIQQAESPDAIRNERLHRFRQAAFSLHVEEHFSRTKRERDRIIYSMLRCKDISLWKNSH